VENLRQLLKTHFAIGDDPGLPAFLAAVNGLGDCAQVQAAVQSLNAEGGVPVHGVIDWDTRNKSGGQLHVLGAGTFYSIESAMFNPLTLGLYLLHNFSAEVPPEALGLPADIDRVRLYDDVALWQGIADSVTMRVLEVDEVCHDVEGAFLSGAKIRMDARYVHMNGHELQRLLLTHAFPFLNRRRTNLLMDVARQGIGTCAARSMPSAFPELFHAIQS